jgi:hypothetical protein
LLRSIAFSGPASRAKFEESVKCFHLGTKRALIYVVLLYMDIE